MTRPSLTAAFCAVALAAVLPAAAHAQEKVFHANMTGAQEVPPKTTDGKGEATVRLDPATRVIHWSVTYSGLSGPATMAHIHGPAAPGANAGVVVPLKDVGTSPITGSATLTEAQEADLMAGKYYVNVHTAQDPGGEIRGQLTP